IKVYLCVRSKCEFSGFPSKIDDIMRKIITGSLGIIFLCAICFASTHGLFRNAVLDGHDADAYPVTQHQFHLNMAEGVVFPRWAPDMRYGYGHPQLQFRPPALHYFAELPYLLTGSLALSLNLAVALMVFIAGFGMYFFAGTLMRGKYSLLAATAYVTANYYLADIYLRGAYYEVAAYAFMPWILWASSRLFHRNASSRMFSFGSVPPFLTACMAWLLLLCGHPQIAAFFVPLGFAYSIFLFYRTRNRGALLLCCLAFVSGILLSAPYTFVAFREIGYVRMELFLVNFENYYRHFISLKTLFFEHWPSEYMGYVGGLDYLGRPSRCEMRGFNLWAIATLVLAPFFWFRGKADAECEKRGHAMFFYFWVIATGAVTLPVSHGLWAMMTFAHTFNFPWRALAVTSLCVAVLCGLVTERIIEDRQWRTDLKTAVFSVLLLAMIVPAFWHARGWCGDDKWINTHVQSRELIAASGGIPQEFYTPKWVRDYASVPAQNPLEVRAGDASVKIIEKGATRWVLEVVSVTGARLVLAQYYYPGWTFYCPGKKAIPAEPDEKGLMSYLVPAGRYRAEIRFALTNDRILAYVFSASGLAAMLAVSFFLAARRK
ncbi:MAG: hypothetical protein WCP55_08570, partial [Lentisphaerota bacterium]